MRLTCFLISVFFCHSIICSRPPTALEQQDGNAGEHTTQQTELERAIHERCTEMIITIQNRDGTTTRTRVRLSYESLPQENEDN